MLLYIQNTSINFSPDPKGLCDQSNSMSYVVVYYYYDQSIKMFCYNPYLGEPHTLYNKEFYKGFICRKISSLYVNWISYSKIISAMTDAVRRLCLSHPIVALWHKFSQILHQWNLLLMNSFTIFSPRNVVPKMFMPCQIQVCEINSLSVF